MQPSRAIWEDSLKLVAADTATYANVAALHVHLVSASFNPSLDLPLGSLTFATFTGSAAKAAGIGTQPTFYDALDGQFTMQLLEPAGGWTWICTADPASAETVYGYAVTDNADAVLLNAGLLDTPVTITNAGQGVIIGNLTMKLLTSSPR